MLFTIKFNDVDINSIVYNNIISFKKNKLLLASYNNNNLKNKLNCIVNNQRIYNIEINKKKISIEIELNNLFRNFLLDLNSHNINYLFKNSKKIFKTQYERDTLENMYKTNLVFKKNTSNSILQINLLLENNHIPIQFFNRNKEKISVFDVKKNDTVQFLFEYGGIIINKDLKFESGWNIIQMRVLKNINESENTKKFNDCMIQYDSDEDILTDKTVYFSYQ